MSIAQRTVWRIDIDKGSPAVRTKNDLYQGDSQANSFACELYRGDTPVTIAGYTVTGAFDRSDGATVPCKGSATGNTAEVLLNEHCYRYSGPFTLSIQLTKGEENRTVLRIAGTVQSSGEGPVVDTDEVLVDLDELLALVDETKAAAQAAAEAAEAANAARESITDVLNMTANGIVIDDIEPADMVHIEDAASRPAVELISHIEPAQTGSGWDSVEAARTRKNMLPPLIKGVRIVSGTGAETTNEKFSATPFAFYDGVSTVYLSGIPTTLSNFVAFYDAKKNFVGRTSGQSIATRQIAPNYVLNTGRTCGEARYLRLSVSEDSSVPGTLDDIDTAQIQLELGEAATEYELYQGQTLTADLPETVYGGTLNWTTGMLVSTLDADGNELVEPKIIQLTPQQLNMLKGVNNVWSNCGETKLVYVADTKKYIDEKFAALAAAQLGV